MFGSIRFGAVILSLFLTGIVAVRRITTAEELTAEHTAVETLARELHEEDGWPWRRRRKNKVAEEEEDILAGPSEDMLAPANSIPTASDDDGSSEGPSEDYESSNDYGSSDDSWPEEVVTTQTTTTTPRKPSVPHDTSLPECLEQPSFKYSYVDEETEETLFTGQCRPSSSPGAYFSADATERWGCWSDETPIDIRSDSAAKDYGYAGACIFYDWFKAATPKSATACGHVPVDCSPGGSLYWGACYSKLSEKWLCFRQPEQSKYPKKARKMINQAAMGDCLSTAVRDDDDGVMYDGVCAFETQAQVYYRCDTVPTYDPDDASTCAGSGAAFHSACFSLGEEVPWQCFPKQLDNPGCESTPSDEGLFDGTCFFPKATEYKESKSASDLEKRDLDDDY